MNKKTIAFLSFVVLALVNSEAYAAAVTSAVDIPAIAWLASFLQDISGPVVYIFCGIAGIAALVMYAFTPGDLGLLFKAFMVLIFIAALAAGWLRYMLAATGTSATIAPYPTVTIPVTNVR